MIRSWRQRVERQSVERAVLGRGSTLHALTLHAPRKMNRKPELFLHGPLARTFHAPVAASRQSVVVFSSDKCGALTRRRYRVSAVHAGCEISRLSAHGPG